MLEKLIPVAMVVVVGLVLLTLYGENMDPTRGPLAPAKCPPGFSRNYAPWLGPAQGCDINRMGTGAACRQCHRTGDYSNSVNQRLGAGIGYASAQSSPPAQPPPFFYERPRPMTPTHPVDGAEYAPWKDLHKPPPQIGPLSAKKDFQPWNLYAPQVTEWGAGAGSPQYTQQSLPTGFQESSDPESAFDYVLDDVELDSDGEAVDLSNDRAVYKVFQDTLAQKVMPFSSGPCDNNTNLVYRGFGENKSCGSNTGAVYGVFGSTAFPALEGRQPWEQGSAWDWDSKQRQSRDSDSRPPFPREPMAGQPPHLRGIKHGAPWERGLDMGSWTAFPREGFPPQTRGLKNLAPWERGLDRGSWTAFDRDTPMWEQDLDREQLTGYQTPYRTVGHFPLDHANVGPHLLFEKGLIAAE